jgi:Ser/Thr protein kinase RdoA (MazF antagonist)
MKTIARLFKIEGTPVHVTRYGEGHINDTYLVTCRNPETYYILQRINDRVFKDIDGLMDNYANVTDHLRMVRDTMTSKVDKVLELIRTTEGDVCLHHDLGHFRMLGFISDSVTLQKATSPHIMELSGEAFGDFQNMLATFDASSLGETIKDFHHTPKRVGALKSAISRAPKDRLDAAGHLIKDALSYEKDASVIQDALMGGSVPLRVTHNDTKLNNLLFRKDLSGVACVIDLDTIMPGSMLFDFGDAIRFGCNLAAEDDPDKTHIAFDLSFFEAYSRGFMRALRHTMTEEEKDLLVDGAFLMTYEVGIRFLTDFLEGDVYFRTSRPGHNLDRATNQLTLHGLMRKAEIDMRETIDRLWEEIKNA